MELSSSNKDWDEFALLSCKQVASLLAISERNLRRWKENGKFPRDEKMTRVKLRKWIYGID